MSKIIKKELINLTGSRYASVSIVKTSYQDFNYEVIVKDGTSNNGYYFYDYTLAEEKFKELIKELKEEK